MFSFNHAMVYSRDVAAALRFYVDLLGFTLIEEVRGPGKPVYARLQAAQGEGTIALHLLPPGEELHTGGVRLYFEVKDLDRACRRLEKSGARFSQLPKLMPWGWKHAYLNDPDGHEVSLYSAGAKRFKKSPMPKIGAARR